VYALARGFSRQHRITEFTSNGYASPLRINDTRIYLDASLQACPSITTDWYGYLPASPHHLTTTSEDPTQPQAAITPKGSDQPGFGWLVPLIRHWTHTHGYGNINPLSIDYACRPRLRSRLTLGGLACPRNPWSFGGQGSHLPYRYSCLHSHSPHLHHQSLDDFTGERTLPYPTITRCRGFGGVLEPRYIIGAQSLDQ
jgi:hypothetical protein